MPWSYPDNVPRPAKNWDAEAQKKCTAAANAVLRESDWDEAGEAKRKTIERNAIFACIRAAGKTKKEISADVILELAEQNPELADYELIEKALGEGQGIGGPKQGVGGTDICVCPECGEEVEHERGIPCAEVECPECGAVMAGKKKQEEKDTKAKFYTITSDDGEVLLVLGEKGWKLGAG